MNESEIESRLIDAGYDVEVIDKPRSPIGPYQAVAVGNGHEVEGWGDTRENALKAVLAAVAAH